MKKLNKKKSDKMSMSSVLLTCHPSGCACSSDNNPPIAYGTNLWIVASYT